jgi:RimJ/RimL family protein N-acetyltransferase
MIAPGPTLETERLILRPTAAEDLDGWTELMLDPDATRFIGGVHTRAQTWRAMASMAGSWALNGFGMFSLIEKDTGLWVGRVGPWMPEGWPGTEVGWSLHPRAHGKGYAVEAATAAMDFAVDELGWTRIVHCIDPANVPSIKVAQRIGSRFLETGQLPEPYQDVEIHLWGQTADEWKARRERN